MDDRVTAGDRAAYKRCRRQWDFSSPNRQELEPVESRRRTPRQERVSVRTHGAARRTHIRRSPAEIAQAGLRVGEEVAELLGAGR